MIRLFPFFFVILWSSAFITGKVIVDHGSPFASLSFRFALVAFGFFCFSYFYNEKIKTNSQNIINSVVSGIFFHGLYLGGCFYAFSIGMPASISALIVSLQPILTNILAGPILNERVTWKQWIGISFGFTGTLLVLGLDIGIDIPTYGLLATLIALFASTAGTLWQKKLSGNLPLTVSNFYQAIGASIFLFIIMLFFEDPFINFSYIFILSMSWQIIMISFGAFSILMYLIKIGSASKTSNLFFLVPPVSALMAWIFLDEKILIYDILGLLICSFGVYIATKNNNFK
jgi:drug/metabolite transporter (DMT)-like permease